MTTRKHVDAALDPDSLSGRYTGGLARDYRSIVAKHAN
jgi:hypothetical protein